MDMDAVTTMNLQRKQFHITRPPKCGEVSDGNRLLLLDFQYIRLCEYPDGALSLRDENPVVSLQET